MPRLRKEPNIANLSQHHTALGQNCSQFCSSLCAQQASSLWSVFACLNLARSASFQLALEVCSRSFPVFFTEGVTTVSQHLLPSSCSKLCAKHVSNLCLLIFRNCFHPLALVPDLCCVVLDLVQAFPAVAPICVELLFGRACSAIVERFADMSRIMSRLFPAFLRARFQRSSKHLSLSRAIGPVQGVIRGVSL